MIVWGGLTGANMNEYLNTGGRYNPTTNTWTPTSEINAPSSRAFHTAVWTGSEMIVWGGLSGFGGLKFSDGGRYNPTSDSWSAVTTTGAPSGRYWHTAVWTGSEMIVWGGWNGISNFNDGGRYNPTANTWEALQTTGAPGGHHREGTLTYDVVGSPAQFTLTIIGLPTPIEMTWR